MGKVILTESQYRRLKKRLINIQLNEQDSGGLVSGLLLGGLVGLAYQAYQGYKGGSYTGVKALFSVCASSGVGKTTMAQGTLNSIANSLFNAVDGLGTDEKAIKDALSQVKTIPDFCAVNRTYSENHPGYTLLSDLDGDIDNDSEWNEYVYMPLLNAKRNTDEIIKKGQLWAKYPCIPSNPQAKPANMPDGSTAYIIGGEVFYNNGRKKKADGTMVSYNCSTTPTPAPGPSEINWDSLTNEQIIGFQHWVWGELEKNLPLISGTEGDVCTAKYKSQLCGGVACIKSQAIDGRSGGNFKRLSSSDANRRNFEAWWKINKTKTDGGGDLNTALPKRCSNVNPQPNPNPKPKTKTIPVNSCSGGKRPVSPTFPSGYESGLK